MKPLSTYEPKEPIKKISPYERWLIDEIDAIDDEMHTSNLPPSMFIKREAERNALKEALNRYRESINN